MSDAAETRPYPKTFGWWILALFTGGWLGVVVLLNLVLVGVLLWQERAVFADPEALAAFVAELKGGEMPPWLLAASVVFQFPLMLGLAEGVRWLGVRGVLGDRTSPLPDAREAYALRWPGFAAVGAGVAMGFTTGWLPGVLAAWLRDRMPWDLSGTVEMVNRAFTEGAPLSQAGLAVGVALMAPIVEELVFRGMLWDALRRTLSPYAVWILTSVVFAVYHMDPVQAVALLFTALVLGWVRLRTGSILPCIGLHMVNNSLGVAGALWGFADTDLGPMAVAVATGFTLAVCGWLYGKSPADFEGEPSAGTAEGSGS
jgi:membrane protease YdiL (CAAX protease family)